MTFQQELAQLINKYSLENSSNTPDFVLAIFLTMSLKAFDATTKQREDYYGIHHEPGQIVRDEKYTAENIEGVFTETWSNEISWPMQTPDNKKHLKDFDFSGLDEIIKIQTSPEHVNYNAYMYGLANGLILAKATLLREEAIYPPRPTKWLENKMITVIPAFDGVEREIYRWPVNEKPFEKLNQIQKDMACSMTNQDFNLKSWLDALNHVVEAETEQTEIKIDLKYAVEMYEAGHNAFYTYTQAFEHGKTQIQSDHTTDTKKPFNHGVFFGHGPIRDIWETQTPRLKRGETADLIEDVRVGDTGTYKKGTRGTVMGNENAFGMVSFKPCGPHKSFCVDAKNLKSLELKGNDIENKITERMGGPLTEGRSKLISDFEQLQNEAEQWEKALSIAKAWKDWDGGYFKYQGFIIRIDGSHNKPQGPWLCEVINMGAKIVEQIEFDEQTEAMRSEALEGAKAWVRAYNNAV